MRRYRVSAKPHPVFRGYRKGGVWFPNAPEYVLLGEPELTEAIRACPLLIIEEVSLDEANDTALGVGGVEAGTATVVERPRPA
ncbi:MAG: hypothetical protein N2651_09235, partial [Fimbriimonadales bacterium]|nr:hypothetical protein [Fimbriimonadales bacterium]